ncbi:MULTISPECIES: putative leader peptide [Micromonospora]
MPAGPLLTSRLAVDLMRVASELCPGSPAAC